MKLHSEAVFATRCDFGCNFWDGEGGTKQKVIPKTVQFSVSVLAVAKNEIETAR